MTSSVGAFARAAASAALLLSGLLGCSPASTKAPAAAEAALVKAEGVAAFCKANGTVDAPPPTGFGPVDENGVPVQVSSIGANRWRCAGGDVLVCADSADGDQCSRKDAGRSPPHLAKACAGQADTELLPTAEIHFSRFDWGCRGGKPYVAKEYELDGRGFLAKAWAKLVTKDGKVIAPQQAPDILR